MAQDNNPLTKMKLLIANILLPMPALAGLIAYAGLYLVNIAVLMACIGLLSYLVRNNPFRDKVKESV